MLQTQLGLDLWTCGRPSSIVNCARGLLGMNLVSVKGNEGVLWVMQGLVMLEKGSKKVVLLTSRVSSDDPIDPDSTIDYINDVTVASDGIIYFTDSVQGIMPRRNKQGFWDTMEAYLLTLFQVGKNLVSPEERNSWTLLGILL